MKRELNSCMETPPSKGYLEGILALTFQEVILVSSMTFQEVICFIRNFILMDISLHRCELHSCHS